MAQAANRSVAHDLRELVNELDFAILVAAVFCDAVKRFLDADRADTARNALPTRFVTEKLRDPQQNICEVRALTEHHDHPGAEGCADRARAFEGQRHVDLVGADESTGRATEKNGLDSLGTAGFLQKLLQRRAEGHFIKPRIPDVAGDTEELRARRIFRADRREARAAIAHDVEHVDERLDVVDDRRLSEKPHLCREGRLVAGLAAKAFNRVEERCLLTANIGAGPTPNLEVDAKPFAHHILAEKTAPCRAIDRVL